jgi:predicted O-methyltransferase YrrM
MKDFYLKKNGRTWLRREARNYPEAWMSEVEVGDFLYGFVRAIKPEKVLEIGTFEGDAAVSIAKGIKDNNFGKLVTTDIKDFGQEKVITEAGLLQFVEIVKSEPLEYLARTQDRFDMVFIDDGHSYPEVIRDLENAHRLTKNHAYILGHDVLMIPDVTSAYSNFLTRYKDQYHHMIIDTYDGVFVLKKIYG